MLFRVDDQSSVPLAEQIAVQVRAAIEQGALTEGNRLPPARELARSLQINMHTVLKGYGNLRDEGLIELRRGSGARVIVGVAPGRVRMNALAAELSAAAHKTGMPLEELLEMITRAYESRKRPGRSPAIFSPETPSAAGSPSDAIHEKGQL